MRCSGDRRATTSRSSPWRRAASGPRSAGRTIVELASRACAAGHRMVVVGAADDARAGTQEIVAARSRGRAIDATGRLSLLASAELIGARRAARDERFGAAALASAMSTPTIAVFGPTVPAFGFGPLRRVASSRDARTSPAAPATATARSSARSAIGAACARSERRSKWQRADASSSCRTFARESRLADIPRSNRLLSKFIVGVDLGGTNIVVGAMSGRRHAPASACAPSPRTRDAAPRAWSDRIVALINAHDPRHDRADERAGGATSSASASARRVRSTARRASSRGAQPRLARLPAARRDRRAAHPPAGTLDNDANCATVGEWWQRRGEGRDAT